MAEFLSEEQKQILMKYLPKEEYDAFSEKFKGEALLPTDPTLLAKRLLELVKEHPFWGETWMYDGKEVYVYIEKRKKQKVRSWPKEYESYRIGGYLFDEAYIVIIDDKKYKGTTNVASILSCEGRYSGVKEKVFINRLYKFQQRYEMQFGREESSHVTEDDWKDSDMDDLLEV